LQKQKGYAFINISGLAIGLTCFILISLFVQFELSYDTFHDKSDQIYRIAKESPQFIYNGNNKSLPTPAPLVGALMEEFPEVEYAVQIAKANAFIDFRQTRFREKGIYATKHFFQLFSFPMIHGDSSTALVDPNSIVLTESLAKKYFGDADPMGQVITIFTLSSEVENDKQEMLVSGVIEDAPANSHFSFDYIVPPMSSREHRQWIDRWESNGYLTYVALRENSNVSEFERKLSNLGEKHLGQLEFYQNNPEKISTFFPQALTDIHLHSRLDAEFQANGDIKYVYLFSLISFMILLIACINYINLATARSATRAMEVGVRKVMGARRGQLVGQFMSEAILPSILALVIAVVMVFMLLPIFGQLTMRDMTLNFSTNGGFVLLLLFIGLGVGILAGSYPALMMSSFNPVSMMKGLLNRSAGKATLRNSLVVVQFAITIALVVGTIVIQRQLHFIENANTGVERDQILLIEIEDRSLFDDRYLALKQTLESNANILGVTAAQADPTNIDAASRANEWEGGEEGQSVHVYRSIIQHDYVDMFGLELVEGRDFSRDISTDAQEGILINETFKKQLGWDTAEGKWLNFHGREARVTGVIKDYNFHSFHQEIAPVALFLDAGWWFAYQRVFVKVNAASMQETIGFVERTMAEFSPGYPFEFKFLDDSYNQMYQTETRLGGLLSYFTLIALFIACLGLLGLATFTAQQRTKEIGVRKVLGASHTNILMLLSKDFAKLVVIAFVVAAPISYFAMTNWLQDFAYHVPVGLGTLALAGIAVLVLAWLTVSYQSFRTAFANPITSLRHQ
ncbi:MAG: ABC transporter permease, partial [Rhodothermales bacterium]